MVVVVADFATSTGGYLTGIGTPILATMFGYFWIQQASKFKHLENANVEQVKALAILLSEHTHVTEVAKSNTIKVDALVTVTEVLKNQVLNHERWHERGQDH